MLIAHSKQRLSLLRKVVVIVGGPGLTDLHLFSMELDKVQRAELSPATRPTCTAFDPFGWLTLIGTIIGILNS